jgi:hypothetical protein
MRVLWKYFVSKNGTIQTLQMRWTPKFGPVAESSEFRVGAGLEQQPRHPNTQ